jgi:hypothetical protein
MPRSSNENEHPVHAVVLQLVTSTLIELHSRASHWHVAHDSWQQWMEGPVGQAETTTSSAVVGTLSG